MCRNVILRRAVQLPMAQLLTMYITYLRHVTYVNSPFSVVQRIIDAANTENAQSAMLISTDASRAVIIASLAGLGAPTTGGPAVL
jgi:hypothetical protein